MNLSLTLKDRVAIITGGGTGIGFGICRVLAARGAKLVLVQHTLDEAERAIQKLGRSEALALAADISKPSAVEQMVGAAINQFGRVDILVNNASVTGLPAIAPLLECSPGKVDEIVDINLKGTFYCSQSVAKQMVAAGLGGNIVHITSVGARVAQESASLYCATKAAQDALARSMALELAPYRIRVNCVAPGDIYTESSAHITEQAKESGASGQYVRVTPIGRRGTPEDVGHAVAYLVSEEASFVTGATLLVDGGFLTY